MTYVFLDTEWADEHANQLVSLALVSEDGTREYYAEVDPLPSDPKRFVVDAVYPLLERGDKALPLNEVASTVADFLITLPAPAVLADHINDLRLLRALLAGERWERLLQSGLIATRMIKDSRMREISDAWFCEDPARISRRHHALVDAHALRHTWRVVTGRAKAPPASGQSPQPWDCSEIRINSGG
jgi:3' exoribonuclease, RNase T-like